MKSIKPFFILIIISITVLGTFGGLLQDLLEKVEFLFKLDPSNQTIESGSSEEVKYESKDASIFFELSGIPYQVNDEGLYIPREFRELIIKENLNLVKFMDEFEFLNFIVYIPPFHVEMLEEFMQGKVDPWFAVSTKPFEELTPEDKTLVSEIGADLHSGEIIQGESLTKEMFIEIVSLYHLNLIRVLDYPENESWEKVKEKVSGFNGEDLALILSLEIQAISEYYEKLNNLLKSRYITFLSGSQFGSEPGLFFHHSGSDTPLYSIRSELNTGRTKYIKTTGYFPSNKEIVQEEIPLLAEAGFTFILLSDKILEDSLQPIEYPDLTPEENESISDFIFFTVENRKIMQILFYHSLGEELFKVKNLDNYKATLEEIYNQIPDYPEGDLFKGKSPVHIIHVPATVFKDYSHSDFSKLNEIIKFTVDTYMFSYINIPMHLNKNNNKNKMLLIRDLHGLSGINVFLEWNRKYHVHFNQIITIEERINGLTVQLEEWEDEDIKVKAQAELEYIKKLFLSLRGTYSDFENFDEQKLFRLEGLLNHLISEFKPEKFSTIDSNENKTID